MTSEPSEEDISRIEKLINDGISGEQYSLMLLDRVQIVDQLSEMMTKAQLTFTEGAVIRMEMSEHIVRLEDGAVVLEARGAVRNK